DSWFIARGDAEFDEQQPGAPEKAQGTEERGAVGDAGGEQIAGCWADEGSDRRGHEEEGSGHVDPNDAPWDGAPAPPRAVRSTDLFAREPARDEEADRAEEVG